MNNILHIGKYYPPYKGGMETVLAELIGGLKFNYKLSVLVANSSNQTIIESNEINLIRAKKIFDFFSAPVCPTFPTELAKIKYDLCHLHLPNPTGEVSYLLSGNKKVPFVLHYHSDIVKQKFLGKMYKPILSKIYDKADKIIAPSPNHIKISPFLRKYQIKTVVIPLSINLSRFDKFDESKVKGIKKKYDRPILMFVGRLVYYKGLDIILKAMQNVNAVLWIIGGGPLENELKEMAKELGISDKVEFLGMISDEEVKLRYHASDLFVLPSNANSEMFGMVQLEAMACHKPVISTNLPTGVSWVNRDGETGFLFEKNNYNELSEKINFLIFNETLRLQLGENGRKHVEDNFSTSKVIQKLNNLYEDLL